MGIVVKLRNILWRILGIDYRHILRVIDYVYLSEDSYARIGHKSYNNNALVFRWSDAPLVIGSYCQIADNVRFVVDKGKHMTDGVTSYPFPENPIGKKGIHIGNDVWIGQGSIILPGVSIGNGVTIAAGSVVTKNLEDYTVVGGVPAHVIKHKCTDVEKGLMNRIAWWNWTDDIVTKRHEDFRLTISEFISKYGVK